MAWTSESLSTCSHFRDWVTKRVAVGVLTCALCSAPPAINLLKKVGILPSDVSPSVVKMIQSTIPASSGQAAGELKEKPSIAQAMRTSASSGTIIDSLPGLDLNNI